ncbi:MAG TPA: VOC family protein [Ktedonobacterales bacterium]|nr:VOC family protein [Ktedonobacterales bacterium]
MPVRIDHVIVAGRDLTQLEAAFTRLGFNVVGGGRHPHLGTRNRIILLDQGYIELLAIADEQVVSPAVRERIETAPGWIGFALQSADIAEEADAMRARGPDVRGPKPGRLVAPDGNVRSWQTVTVGSDDLFSAAEPLPFVIQHDSSGVQHQQELAGADPISPHPNGARRLQAVVLAVANVMEAERAFERTYGLAPSEPVKVAPFVHAMLTLKLPANDDRIILAEPLGAGIINDRLVTAGEGVCCVSVAVADLDVTHDYLQQNGVPLTQWENGLMIPATSTGGAPLAFVKDISE